MEITNSQQNNGAQAKDQTNPEDDQFTLTPNPPIPYTFDLGNLLISDTNPLPPHPTESQLTARSSTCAQSLISQLLLTCPIHSSPSSGGVYMKLPPPTTPLPREKPLPVPKQPTKWEQFAARKGIKDKRRGKTEGKMVFDEEKGEWVPKWGYKGRNKEGEGEWIVEVDEKKESELGEGKTVRGEKRRERMEKVKRGERRQRANERRGRKGGGGG
ncbi:Rhodanese-related sulfurtransferase [Lecanora helva]